MPSVGASQNYNCLTSDSVPDKVGKPTNQRSPNIAMSNLIEEWSFSESVDDLRNFGMELSAEIASLRLIPELRFSKIKFGGATDLNFVAQRSNRSRRPFTSGHEL